LIEERAHKQAPDGTPPIIASNLFQHRLPSIQAEQPSRKRVRKLHALTIETVRHHFHLPLKVAAKNLGVSPTYLKQVCRKLGIPRWPYRQMKAFGSFKLCEGTVTTQPTLIELGTLDTTTTASFGSNHTIEHLEGQPASDESSMLMDKRTCENIKRMHALSYNQLNPCVAEQWSQLCRGTLPVTGAPTDPLIAMKNQIQSAIMMHQAVQISQRYPMIPTPNEPANQFANQQTKMEYSSTLSQLLLNNSNGSGVVPPPEMVNRDRRPAHFKTMHS